MGQFNNLLVTGVSRLLSKLYVNDSVTAPTFIGKLQGNADTATTSSKLGRNGNAGVPMTFNWSGKDGQPTWLWGGENGSDMYVYNPNNFSVKYSTTAGSAPANGGNSTTVNGHTVNADVPSGAKFTDTHTDPVLTKTASTTVGAMWYE